MRDRKRNKAALNIPRDHAPEDPDIPREEALDSSEVTAQPVHHGGRLRDHAFDVEADELGRYALTEGIGIEDVGAEDDEPVPDALMTEPIEPQEEAEEVSVGKRSARAERRGRTRTVSGPRPNHS